MWTGNLLGFPVLHFRSELFPVIVLHPLDQLIEDHGDRAQDDDGGDHHVELEETDSGNDRDKYAKHFPIQIFCDLRVAPLTENTLRYISRKQ